MGSFDLPTADLPQYTLQLSDAALGIDEDAHGVEEERTPRPSQCKAVPSISTTFKFTKQLGSGASCRVLEAQHKENGKFYAVKELRKCDASNAQTFVREVDLLKKLHHPNILNYFDCFEDDQCFYIATELCQGGTCLDKIIRMKSFSERKASKYIEVILSAVHYMHSMDIVHCDLKAQNLVFNKPGVDGVLQVIDFGEGQIVSDDETYNHSAGTPHYMPPEITRPRTGAELKKGDLWSIGVICYILVCGRPPFTGATIREILESITAHADQDIYFPPQVKLTDSCRDFISKLLCHDTALRMSASEALQHEWIAGNTASESNLSCHVLSSLKRLRYEKKLHKVLVDAMLSGVDRDRQKALTQGLLTLNRQRSTMDNQAVVNYLLLNSPMIGAANEERTPQRKNVRFKFNEDKMVHLDDEGLGLSPCTEQDVDEVLNNLDFTSMSDDEENFGMQLVSPMMAKLVSSPSFLTSPALTATVSNASYVSTETLEDRDSIPVEHFRDIMERSPKKYDVDGIVEELEVDGVIPLSNIASCNLRMKTICTDED